MFLGCLPVLPQILVSQGKQIAFLGTPNIFNLPLLSWPFPHSQTLPSTRSINPWQGTSLNVSFTATPCGFPISSGRRWLMGWHCTAAKTNIRESKQARVGKPMSHPSIKESLAASPSANSHCGISRWWNMFLYGIKVDLESGKDRDFHGIIIPLGNWGNLAALAHSHVRVWINLLVNSSHSPFLFLQHFREELAI